MPLLQRLFILFSICLISFVGKAQLDIELGGGYAHFTDKSTPFAETYTKGRYTPYFHPKFYFSEKFSLGAYFSSNSFTITEPVYTTLGSTQIASGIIRLNSSLVTYLLSVNYHFDVENDMLRPYTGIELGRYSANYNLSSASLPRFRRSFIDFGYFSHIWRTVWKGKPLWHNLLS